MLIKIVIAFLLMPFCFSLSLSQSLDLQNPESPESLADEIEEAKGTCFPKRIVHSGTIDRVMTIEYDSVSNKPMSLLTVYDDGYLYLKEFLDVSQGRYRITEYNQGELHKVSDYISLGGKGIFKSTYARDLQLERNEKPTIVEFGELSFKQDTILMSSVYHDRSADGDTTKTEILIRRQDNDNGRHLSREIYTNGELVMLVLYEDYEERFNPISYVESLSMNYLPMYIFKKQTVITYAKGNPQQKTVYLYDVEYNDDLLPTKIEMKLGDELKESWEIEYSCFD